MRIPPRTSIFKKLSTLERHVSKAKKVFTLRSKPPKKTILSLTPLNIVKDKEENDQIYQQKKKHSYPMGGKGGSKSNQ
ncbi:hypothetical protein TNIN_430221 [Trichonephila inaurata madagascariensis]|uniref:Uncharacterized protein n=1 Tax=Trichonephila inaurata madagascariensis TaxID=2747483 RepID=A0A8X7C1D1_9ARAC|nr:hypothetical protein TNIN_430221 [Trichonephila inaurata madagascariensis]